MTVERKKKHSDESNHIEIERSRGTLQGDRTNVVLLFLLYTLQGIPLGLSAAIPMILQNRGVNYKQQAEFSFVNWPFSLKLLWAPIVDSVYSSRMGRRKTWLVPAQYFIGTFMLYLSCNVNSWLGIMGEGEPNIGTLTLLFFTLNFLAATQDIAVDGWALTMLRKENVGHASTCNSVGQTAGFFLSFVLFMALESANFCNKYLRSAPEPEGIVTLAGFLFFWGWVFIVITTLILIFKRENRESGAEHNYEPEHDVKTAYTSLWEIVKLKSVQILVLLLLTGKIGFSATDSVMSLKLIEAGIPKEHLGLLAVPLIPLQIALPLIIAKYSSGSKPLNIYLKVIPYRLVFGCIAALFVWITPQLLDKSSHIPIYYYLLLLICYALHQICVYCMFVSSMAFFAKISDPVVGGTYMTLLNTVSNLGGNWPATLALWLVDNLTTKTCTGSKSSYENGCRSPDEEALCAQDGGHCSIYLDGFYVETAICVIIGFLWLHWARHHINHIQFLPEKKWKLAIRKRNNQ